MSRLSLFNSPLLLGFEEFERRLDHIAKMQTEGYPPYNIEQTGDSRLRITLAVAGFSENEVSIQLEDNQLVHPRPSGRGRRCAQLPSSRYRGTPIPAQLRPRGQDRGA